MQRPRADTNRFQRALFLKREYEAIKGKGSYVFWMLYAILLLALGAVAVGRTGLDELEFRMADPFTTMIEIPATNTTVLPQYTQVLNFLERSAQEKRFLAKLSSGSYTTSLESWSEREGYWEYLRARSFGYAADKPLLEAILSPENLVEDLSDGVWKSAGAFRDGIIVTEELIDRLGIDRQDLRQRKMILRDGLRMFPVTVLSVVRTLPARYDVLMEHGLRQCVRNSDERESLTAELGSMAVLLAVEHEPQAELTELNRLGFDCSIATPDTLLSTHPWCITCLPGVNEGMKQRSERQQKLLGEFPDLAPIILNQVNYGNVSTDSKEYGQDGTNMFDFLTITFSSSDSIMAFQQELGTTYKIDLDLDRVRSKENFAIVSRLSEFLILALVVFSALSILLFLYNLLKNHLERIKMNLGTFMAFGLSQRFLLSGYLRIIVKLLARAMLLSMLTLVAMQGVIKLLALADVRSPALLAQLHVLTNPWLYATLAFLLVAAYLIFRRQLNRFLASTPGDLIYARQ